VITSLSGVFLDLDDARYLVEVLEHAGRIARPSPRVADIIRRLRRTVDATNASANENVRARANQDDVGQTRAYDLLSAGEAARILGCSTANLRYLQRKGVLPAHRAGSRWLYPAEPVVARAERQARRREQSCRLTSARSVASS
jgi:hypothetical protein